MEVSMSEKGSYIIVGENIHCTRVRLTKGKFVKEMPDGSFALVFSEQGESNHLPLPDSVVNGENFKNGKVRHVAVALQQGLNGPGEEKGLGKRYIQAMALAQEANGAWFLDLNVDEFSLETDEKLEAVRWAAGILQEVSSVP